MKKRLVETMGLVMIVGAVSIPMAHAADVLCEEKAEDIREQLEYAREHDNQHRVEGLQRALASIEKDCTNEAVFEDAAEDVRESQSDVQEQQAELEEALRDGDEGDIQESRADLEEATRELEADTEALNTLQHRLAE